MKVTPLAIPDVLLFEPQVFRDERGLFYESFNAERFEAATGLKREFVQDNHSVSRKGTLRGLHYQAPPFEQGKLVRVARGAVFDVAVDIRPGSPTFGRWAGDTLSAQNHRQLWIPEGFAHGFLALEDDTVFLYKTTKRYDRASERVLRWNDPGLRIDWPLAHPPLLSGRDAQATGLDWAQRHPPRTDKPA